MHISEISRRSFIRISMAGMASSAGLRAAPVARRRAPQAKSVLVLFEQGGVSQIDSFDPKPDTPSEHRSPFRSVRTRIPGVHFTELLNKTARQADKLTVVRCMRQPTPGVGNSHPMGSQYIFSGEAPGGPVEMPDIGCVVSALLGSGARHLPSYIQVPGTSEQGNMTRVGFLSASHTVFKTGGRLADPNWRVPNLGLAADIDPRRFKDRMDLLSNLDIGLIGAGENRQIQTVQSLAEQAEDMLSNPRTREAFDLAGESDATHDLYGRGHRGQCYLLGRKLIEAGVRYVLVDVREPNDTDKYPGGTNMNWDHHDFIYSDHSTDIKGGGAGAGRWGIATRPMMGSTDHAFAGLLEDMDRRGLLAETLVCFVTEFGRTPKINERKGRDHWIHAFSFAFAGAGVPGGQVVGETDANGGSITSSMAYTIEDYAATLYEKLGIDRTKPLYTPTGRPVYIAHSGRPIPELFS